MSSSSKKIDDFKIPLKEIVEATNNFENLIGEGGFGKVYKGNLLWTGKLIDIAARRLHGDYGQGDLEFWNEISMLALSGLKHDNLVSFVGYCDEDGQKIVVTKYEAKQSLDVHLKDSNLSWTQRLQICVGIAHALSYIHYDEAHDLSVIHRNIKSSKVLLDEKWEPKLSGFGISLKNSKARRHRYLLAEVIGTIGYVDPTYEKTGFVTHKSDVFSFGVLLFEVLCGRKAFRPDEQEQHSPQLFKYDNKEGMLDGIAGTLRESNNIHTPGDGAYRQSASFVPSIDDFYKESASSAGGQPPSIDGGYRKSASFIGRQPSSFTSGNSQSGSFIGRQSSSSNNDNSQSASVNTRAEIFVKAFYDSLKLERLNSQTASPAKEATASASPAMVTTTSAVNLPTTSPANELLPGFVVSTQSPADDQLPVQYDSSTEQNFTLHPLYTMKRLELYIHNPNEELLAQLVRYHYDDLENNLDLDDMIDQALKEQMDPESFKIFSETAYGCLKEQRSQRPNIDLILNNLKIALAHQMKRENLEQSHIPGEVEGTSSSSKRLEGRHLDHLKIPLSEIEMATKKFTQKYLGSGAYGKVYRADLQLPLEENDQGEIAKKRTVAIKCIRDDKHGKEGFVAEIELLTSCKHPNVVSLLGFCDEGPNMILVYEHAPNKSLDDYLGSTNNPIYLTWAQRIKIGLDIARGLHYLHTKVEDEQRIIHRDIKSGNILLGKNWAAKIADFGLSRFHHVNQQGETLYTGTIAGTKVYLCPEYMNTGRLKRAVDIYSLGVVLFEILSGKLANDRIFIAENEFGIAHVARRRFQEGSINEMVDPKIMEEVDELTSTLHKGPNQDSLQTFIEIAHQCIAETQDKRPTANDIVDKLEVARVLQEINKDNFQMSFEEIEVATEKFSRKMLIGGGGFGLVYKGQIGGNVIAVKRLDKKQLHDRQAQGELHFLTELEILFEYKHKNIISLEGYCNRKDEKIIVYEYASQGSLDRHLKKKSLTWIKRLQICIDVACGLAYLHRGAQTNEMVIHRDIKCANILLNGDWKAKISDFGLSSITATNQEDISHLVGTNGYLDPEYESTGFFTEKSDIYSFGVVLFEILYGKLVAPDTKNYDQKRVDNILKDIHKKENLDYIVFLDIKRQIAPESLSTFQKIVSQCLQSDRESRPTAEQVLQQLTTALEFQEEFEIWQPKLPKDYKEIIQMSKSPEMYSTKNNKDLYNILSNGILLPKDKVWFSLGNNGEINEMISARKFSYKKGLLHKWRSIGESRFQKVAKMLNISNLDIQIQIKTRFLSPDVTYGVYLVFKFSDLNTISISKPLYVNLRYKMESENLQSYFATSRDDKWMMIELYRFLNHKENNDFSFLLESLSRYHCRSDAIYVEGIEFRAIDKASLKNLFPWQPSRGSPEYSPLPSPKMTSPGPSSRIHSGAVTPLHPRAGGAAIESQINRPEDIKQKSHRLPLPPVTISNPLPFSQPNSAATSPSVPRSPGRSDNLPSPGSRWKKGKLLGRGSFGRVYAGFNSESGEMCAMKEVTLFSYDAKSKESAKQLGQEVSLLSRLSHPNIVRYYGSEMVDDKLYIYLEYVSGGSIYKLLQDYGQFGELAIRSYTQQILSGLAYLHAKNTIHRDIKGANILVDPNGGVKLADFGMAKHIIGQTRPLSFKGSPYWTAPEIIKNSWGSNLAVDIWSLGCTVLEMATTKPPWSQYEGVAALFKIVNSKELPVIPDHLSEEGKDFVRQCLQRNPLNRPTTAQLLDHCFVKNAAPLERPVSYSEPCDPVPGIANGVKSKDNDKLKQVQSSPNANLNMEQLLADYDDIIKRSSDELEHSSNYDMLHVLIYFSLPIDNNKKLFSINKVNGKKCHMLPAEAILHKFSNVKLFALEDSVDSRFKKVVKLLSRHVFRIKCKIESALLSSDTKYACYLVFKLSDECGGLHHPVKVRDQLHGKNKEIEIIYFRSPSPINLHDTFRVPEKGKYGWMEVNVWEFNTDKELKGSHVPMDLILTSYQGTMRGLILNGIEFRPM